MSLRSRLSKLEETAGAMNKPLFEMGDAELERFLRKHLSLPEGAPITDEMLLDVALSGEVLASRYTHEETLELLK